MTRFPDGIDGGKSFYQRILKGLDLTPERETAERSDIVGLSAEASRRKIFEETRSAVLSRIRAGS